MKKIKILTAALAAVMLFVGIAYAQNETEEKKPTRYLYPASNFSPVACERINIDKAEYYASVASEAVAAAYEDMKNNIAKTFDY